MARIPQGIFGAGSGKVGPGVMTSWKGIPVMKLKPVSVANPRTAGQVAQRARFSIMVADARVLLAAIIQPFWNPFASRMSGYNYWMQQNKGAFDDTGLVTPGSFYGARGSLLNVEAAAASASQAAGSIDITWTDNSGQSDALGTDYVNAVIYNSTQDYWVTSVEQKTRADAALSVADANFVQNDDLYVYVFASRPNVSKVADSTYVDVVAAA